MRMSSITVNKQIITGLVELNNGKLTINNLDIRSIIISDRSLIRINS
jgi:ABC-type lipopolysaccharide export system ATPase subunit